MLRKDYLVFQIEELAKFMAKLLATLSGLTFDEAIESVETALAERGLVLDDILHLEDSELIETLKQNPAFDSGNIENLADILIALGDKSDDVKWYGKGLFLLEYLNASDKIFSLGRNAKIEYLKTRL
ncbi:hypothetical protein HUK80_09075 [Flavobacterium sp. MAH-1]|uniref:Uncharacterized protein n=1 Tax=Flavobacterium agri TaxID=2743471 RepID=A0A7Y8Y345_9FLAO|nr:hypothetical protein [Flavobacterium agri]NUY81044.1 hypothetical protein [Flavobacterium agri]NYA71068.1 hypothetical protein [Flavobacterium agri]